MRDRIVGAVSQLPGDERVASGVVIALLGLTAIVVLWSFLLPLNNSLWGDEAYSVSKYIGGGPGAIWDSSKFIQNNTMMFNFLTWATTDALGTHTEATYRLWGVLPALGAGVVMVWWLWRCFDRWTAVVFAVAAAAAPIYLALGTQARGYGIGFLVCALYLVAGERYSSTHRRAWLIVFATAGFVGVTTLVPLVLPFLGAAVVLLTVRAIRRQVIIAVAAVGLLALLWYAPVISALTPTQKLGGLRHLPVYGFVWQPVRDLIGLQIHWLEPAISVAVGSILGAVAVMAGVVVLWRRMELLLLGLFAAPVIASFVFYEFAMYYRIRFGAVELLPVVALAAVGVTSAIRAVARTRALRIAAVLLLVSACVVTLGRLVHQSAANAAVPFEGAKDVAAIVKGIEAEQRTPVILNRRLTAFVYALRRYHPVVPTSAARLERALCSLPVTFVYVQNETPPIPNTSCLLRRGAFQINVPEKRLKTWVWLVPALPRKSCRQPRPLRMSCVAATRS